MLDLTKTFRLKNGVSGDYERTVYFIGKIHGFDPSTNKCVLNVIAIVIYDKNYYKARTELNESFNITVDFGMVDTFTP